MIPEILFSNNFIDYDFAFDFMSKRQDDVVLGIQNELIWMLEHRPVYTSGTSAKAEDLLGTFANIPVVKSNRGGQYTHHAPGQQVCYLVLDLKKRFKKSVPDVRAYVCFLERCIIKTLKYYGVNGELRDGRIGVWVVNNEKEEKIAAIGIRIKKGVTMHGFCVNVKNDLSSFGGIVPCGLADYGVCSLQSLGIDVEIDDFRKILLDNVVSSLEVL